MGDATRATGTGGATINANGADGGTGLIFSAANFTIAQTSTTASRTLSLGGSNKDANTISGVIANVSATTATNVSKTGPGSWMLAGANTYTGTTNVVAGTLIVTGSLPAGAVTIGGLLTGSGSVAGATTISSGGSYNAGNPSVAAGVGTQSFASTLSFANGSIFEWDLDDNSTSTGFDKVTVGGDITVGTTGTVFKVILGANAVAGLADSGNTFWNTPNAVRTWAMSEIFGKALTTGAFQQVSTSVSISPTLKGTFSVSGTNLTWTAVPEPSNTLIGLLAGAGLLRRRRG